MHRKIAILLGTVLVAATTFTAMASTSASGESLEPANNEQTEEAKASSLWRSTASAVPTSSEVDLLAQFDGKRYGSFTGNDHALEPIEGHTIGVREMSGGTLCGQANIGSQPILAWCGTTFEANGLSYAYNTGTVPGTRSSVLGLALPGVTSITLQTSLGEQRVEIAEGGFWWRGQPNEVVESMTVEHEGREFTERAGFVPEASFEAQKGPIVVE